MSSGGFWPGEAPAAEHGDVEEPEAPVAEPLGWPRPHEDEEPAAEAEAEPEVAEASVAEPEPTEEEEEPEEEPELVPAGHLPGELDIPDGVAVLEGSPSGAD